MKEKFTKLFGALILVALMLGLVLPFQTAAAEDISGTAYVTVVATDGLTANAGTVEIDLTPLGFTPVGGDGTYYKLARSATESGTRTPITVTATDPVAHIHVSDTTAVPGTKYWYWANVCDAVSCSATYGDTGWRALTVGTMHGDATAAYDRITVDITLGSGVLPTGGSYKIYRKSTATWSTTPLVTTSAVTYADLTAMGQLLDGTDAVAYDYRIALCGANFCSNENDGGTGAYGAVAGPTTRKVPGGTTPLAVAATDGTVVGKVDVTWTAADGANLFYAWRGFGATMEPAAPLTFASTSTGGSDLWAVAGRTYTYYVYVCSLGTENCSDTVSNTGFIVGAQPVVSGLQATDGTYTSALGASGILVTWPAITWPLLGDQVEYYNLYRSDDAAGNTNVVTVTGAVAVTEPELQQVEGAMLAFEDTNVDIGKDYYYWVVACHDRVTPVCGLPGNKDGGWAPIPVPTVTLGAPSTTGVSASWTNVDVNATYLGFRSPTSSFSAAIPAGGVAIPGLSGTDTSGTAGVTYWYFIKACVGTRCSDPSTAAAGLKLLP